MSGISMPTSDAAVLARHDEVVRALRRIVPGEGVIARERIEHDREKLADFFG